MKLPLWPFCDLNSAMRTGWNDQQTQTVSLWEIFQCYKLWGGPQFGGTPDFQIDDGGQIINFSEKMTSGPMLLPSANVFHLVFVNM